MYLQYFVTTLICVPMFILTILVGVSGNMMVVIDHWRNRELYKRPFQYLIFNIAVADLIMCGVFTPILLLYRFNEPFHLISITPFCEVFLFSAMLGISMQYFLFPLLAYNRREKICSSDAASSLSLDRAKRLVSLFWRISVASASVFAGIAWNYNSNLGDHDKVPKLHRCLVINEAIDAYAVYFLVYCVPLYGGAIVASAVLYTQIQSNINNVKLSDDETKDLAVEVRRFHMSAVITVTYTLGWTPFLLVQLYGTLHAYNEVLFNAHAITTAIGVATSAINPMIYYKMDDYYYILFKTFGRL